MLKSYCDGACRGGNPGQCSCAFAVFNSTGDLVASGKRYLGPELHTNNYAEYQGLLDLLKWAEKEGRYNLTIYCDSKLIVNQVMDVWDVNSEELRPLWQLAYSLRVRRCHVLEHVKGHSGNPGNEFCDKLCNEALNENGK